MNFRASRRYSKIQNELSLKTLRLTNKLLFVYSSIITVALLVLAYKYMSKSNADTERFIAYDAQVAQLTTDRDYYYNNAQMFSETTADLIEITTQLNIDRDTLIADNEYMLHELEIYKHKEELYDKYEYALFYNGERTDITYEHLDSLEQMVEETSVPNPDLILAIIGLESHYNCQAYNPNSGASGFGQFLPSTARSVWIKVLGNSEESWDPDMIFDPDVNLQLTVAYMDYLIEKHGSPREALRQYSGSGSNEAHLNGYIATLDSYLRHTDAGTFAEINAQY